MIKLAMLLALTGISFMDFDDGSFRKKQRTFDRVKNAYSRKEKGLQELFKEKGIDYGSFDLYIRAFKREGKLEVFAKGKSAGKYQLFTTYNFCTLSGKLGPKRMQGDLQVPEGFYHIDRFNPASNYHLSLGLNYPNYADKIAGKGNNLGGDIFIHGNCVSIGCIPITDEKIMELYILCVEAKSGGQEKIPVHIFPTRLNEEGIIYLKENYSASLNVFWNSLRDGYDYFEKNFFPPVVSTDAKGNYLFK